MEDIIMATLDSEEGQKLLAETTIKQPLLMRLFKKQVVDGYCGVTSAALLLSARVLGEKYAGKMNGRESCVTDGGQYDMEETTFDLEVNAEDAPYTESNIFDFEMTRSVVGDGEELRRKGANLGKVCALLRAHDRRVTKRHVHAGEAYAHKNRICNCVDAEGTYADLDAFRREAVNALSRADSSSGVMVNFQQDASLWYGHFSPLAAYHEEKDCFLLLDTRQKKPLVWVHAAGLFHRMNTADGSISRGYLIVC